MHKENLVILPSLVFGLAYLYSYLRFVAEAKIQRYRVLSGVDMPNVNSQCFDDQKKQALESLLESYAS